jgi:hypothetical protein
MADVGDEGCGRLVTVNTTVRMSLAVAPPAIGRHAARGPSSRVDNPSGIPSQKNKHFRTLTGHLPDGMPQSPAVPSPSKSSNVRPDIDRIRETASPDLRNLPMRTTVKLGFAALLAATVAGVAVAQQPNNSTTKSSGTTATSADTTTKAAPQKVSLYRPLEIAHPARRPARRQCL